MWQSSHVVARARAYWDSLPAVSRAVLVTCSTLYLGCLATGWFDFEPVCLNARMIVQYLQLYRVATAPFLHMSILHVAFNMLAWVPIAAAQERELGSLPLVHTLVLLILLGSAIFTAGSYALALWGAETWLQQCAVGFSGVVFGAIVLDNHRSGVSRRSIFGLLTVPASLYPWALLVLWQLLLPGVSFLGHLGGVLAGEAIARGLCGWCIPSQSRFEWLESTRPGQWLARDPAFVLVTGERLRPVGLPTSYSAQAASSSAAGTSWWSQWLHRGWAPVPGADPDARPGPSSSSAAGPSAAPQQRQQQQQPGGHRLSSASSPQQPAGQAAAAAAEARAAKAGKQPGRGAEPK